MRIAATLLLLLAALWAGGWFVAARVVERAAETWFAEVAADGVLAGYDHLAVEGFPLRLSLRLEEPRLVDPLTGNGWAAEGAEAVLALATPSRLRLRPAGAQTLWLDGQRLGLVAADLGAELHLQGMQPRPTAISVTAAEVVLSGLPAATGLTADEPAPEGSWAITIARVAGQLGLVGAAPALALDLDGLDPDTSDWPTGIAPRPAGPIERLALSGRAEFDGPVEAGGRLVALQVEMLRMVWGATELSAAGRVEIDTDGLPQGRITTTAREWRPLLALAVATGAVTADLAPTWARVIETMQEAGPEPARATGALEVPLVFQRGRISLGPLPLGRAPLLGPPGG